MVSLLWASDLYCTQFMAVITGFHENYYYRTKPGETVGEFMRRIRGRSGSSLLQYRLCAPGSSIYLDDDELMTYSSVKVVRFR